MAAKEAKEKLEAELKAVAEAKEKAEAEMRAAMEAKQKLEAELKATAEAKENSTDKPAQKHEDSSTTTVSPANETANSTTLTTVEAKTPEQTVTNDNAQEQVQADSDIDDEQPSAISIEEIENQIKKLIEEKRIIQTYQPVISMFDSEGETKEVYKIGLQAIIEEDDNINEHLTDTSIYSVSLQQIINEWVLRQVFLRITESGTANCQYQFLINISESWFSDITLFNWLQKILSQTKKYTPGKSIILDVPLDIFKKHQKRAQALLNTLHKSHHFSVALSNIDTQEDISNHCSITSSKLLIVNVDQLQKLTEVLAPQGDEKTEEDTEKQNMLQYLKSSGVRIITTGIEDSTLLTDAITVGTDYAIGDFVGETQDNLAESGSVESFELT